MNPIEKYFNAEKYESVLFVLVGLVAIACASYFLLKLKQPFYTGLSYALIAIALIQLIVGITVWLRSPKDIVRVNTMLINQNEKIKSEEIPRMQQVLKNFKRYEYVEIACVFIGLILMVFLKENLFLKGLGLGLIIQALFMFGLDFFAKARGEDYLDYLTTL
jgi:uncharacterized membrane protein